MYGALKDYLRTELDAVRAAGLFKDERVLLTEGPYDGSRTYDAETDHLGVVRKLLDLAILFDAAR